MPPGWMPEAVAPSAPPLQATAYSCSRSRHLSTRLLQLCPLRSAIIHITTLILGSTHCCSSNKRSQSQRPHHNYTETTALASHPCPYRIQNLPPHVSHPFWNFSVIRSCHPWLFHALLPDPENSEHPREGILLLFAQILSLEIVLSRTLDLKNGTAFLFQFVNAHLLPNLSQNLKPTYSFCTFIKNVA